MIKAKFIGDESYQTKVFNAATGNTVSMPDNVWEEIKSKGDDKLFENVTVLDEDFAPQKTIYIPKK